MVNIRASTCQCGKAVPSFGVPGQHAAIYSPSHSLCLSNTILQSCNFSCHAGCLLQVAYVMRHFVFWCSSELSTVSKTLQLVVLNCRKFASIAYWA